MRRSAFALRLAASLFATTALTVVPSAARAQEDAPTPPSPPAAAKPEKPEKPEKPDALVTNDTSAHVPPGTVPPVRASSEHEGRFEFGGYGRVYAASDLRGGTARGTNVVAFGPRIVDEGNYAELELRREDKWNEKVSGRIVATLALFPPFFHFSGKPEQAIAVRNLYAQGTYEKVTMWAGSRMYRGDDIYLLNWWPLDNQNTVGGGVGAPIAKSDRYETIVQAHFGMQRLDNPYQFQQVPVVAPFGFGTVNVTKLDRPRTIETLKVTEFIRPGAGAVSGFKVVGYGELHQIAAGTFRDPLTDQERGLPSDTGFMLGTQLTYFTGVRDTYASLVLRHARGIAAYDPLAVPITFALDRTVSGSSETTVALSGNYETESFGITAAGYMRFFRDGGPSETSIQKYDEGSIVARPSVFLSDYFGVSLEASYQQRRIAFLQPGADAPLSASVTKFGVMPYFSPGGRGTFKRPQIRLLYVASLRNQGARGLYANEDAFSQRSTEHFLGVGAEWWFNSSSYP